MKNISSDDYDRMMDFAGTYPYSIHELITLLPKYSSVQAMLTDLLKNLAKVIDFYFGVMYNSINNLDIRSNI